LYSEISTPYTEIFYEGKYIKIVLDMPGAMREDIIVEASENDIVVYTSGLSKRYYKKISFKKPIKPETARAKYRNGVLTIIAEVKHRLLFF